jgi:hypothetical protein
MSDVTITVTESNPVITVSDSDVNVAVTDNVVTVTDAVYMKYGAFEYLGRQAITSTTTAFAMPWDTTDFSGDVYIANTSRIYFPTAGLYNLQWSGQFQNTANAQEDINVWLRINGTDVVSSNGLISINARKSAGEYAHEIIGWNYFLQLTAGQYVEIMWSATGTSVSLESYSAGTNPTRPTTAALILTAQQVA